MLRPRIQNPQREHTLEVSFGYTPRELQAEIHRKLQRFSVLVLHRRFGKTILALHQLFSKALQNEQFKRPQYAYIGPTYKQAKKIAWDIMKDIARTIPGAEFNEAELRIDIHLEGREPLRIYCMGADNPDSFRGMYFDGVVLDEYAEMDPRVWTQNLRPALSDKTRQADWNQWAIFIGTPKGRNHFYDIHQLAKKTPGWFTCVYRASETGYVEEKELEAAKREMSDEEFDQEYECDFSASIKGAYYKQQIRRAEKEGRICRVPHEPVRPVDCSFDLGKSDGCAIWFHQQVGPERRFLDYAAGQGWDVAEIGLQLKGTHDACEWPERRKQYRYGTAYLPWDANATRMGMGGKSIADQIRELKIFARVEVLPKTPVMDGIQQVRRLFHAMWFDLVTCEAGLEALRNYTKDWNEATKTFSEKPKHNWASHGADGMRTYAMADRPAFDPEAQSAAITTDYDIFDY
jgi:phage terminase large subunit